MTEYLLFFFFFFGFALGSFLVYVICISGKN